MLEDWLAQEVKIIPLQSEDYLVDRSRPGPTYQTDWLQQKSCRKSTKLGDLQGGTLSAKLASLTQFWYKNILSIEDKKHALTWKSNTLRTSMPLTKETCLSPKFQLIFTLRSPE